MGAELWYWDWLNTKSKASLIIIHDILFCILKLPDDKEDGPILANGYFHLWREQPQH